MTLITSTCPGGQCPVPYESPSVVVQTPSIVVQPPLCDAVVRITNRGYDGNTLGSGTVVAGTQNQMLVLTCAHLFSESLGPVDVRFSDGRVVPARMLLFDRKWDLAALSIPPTSTVRPPPIAGTVPKPGEPVFSCGYGPTGIFSINQGMVRGYINVEGTTSYETLNITGFARQGDSGGPMFSRNGELVAVLWGSNGQMVAGTYCGRIRRFLSRLLSLANSGCLTPPAMQPLNPMPPTEPSVNIQTPQVPRQEVSQGVSSKTPEGDEASDERSGLVKRLDEISAGVSKFHGVAEGLTDRLGNVEQVAQKVQKLGLLEKAGSSRKWLTVLMGTLGWSTPPSLALIIGLQLAARILRRRIKKRTRRKASSSSSSSTGRRSRTTRRKRIVRRGKQLREVVKSAAAAAVQKQERPKQRTLNDDYAKQLAQVYSLSGRSAMGDVTLGREYDEELRKAETSSDARLAEWAGTLRRRVADRFNRIHGLEPSPADPIEA